MFSISVVLPAYNEQANLKETLENAVYYLQTICRDWEIIVNVT